MSRYSLFLATLLCTAQLLVPCFAACRRLPAWQFQDSTSPGGGSWDLHCIGNQTVTAEACYNTLWTPDTGVYRIAVRPIGFDAVFSVGTWEHSQWSGTSIYGFCSDELGSGGVEFFDMTVNHGETIGIVVQAVGYPAGGYFNISIKEFVEEPAPAPGQRSTPTAQPPTPTAVDQERVRNKQHTERPKWLIAVISSGCSLFFVFCCCCCCCCYCKRRQEEHVSVTIIPLSTF